jgi:hypothetical protein
MSYQTLNAEQSTIHCSDHALRQHSPTKSLQSQSRTKRAAHSLTNSRPSSKPQPAHRPLLVTRIRALTPTASSGMFLRKCEGNQDELSLGSRQKLHMYDRGGPGWGAAQEQQWDTLSPMFLER